MLRIKSGVERVVFTAGGVKKQLWDSSTSAPEERYGHINDKNNAERRINKRGGGRL